MKLLVTGGSGFIGSNYIRYVLENYPYYKITNVDKMTYAAHPQTQEELEEIAGDRYQFLHMDIADPGLETVVASQKFDAIVNFAAETHVDRSILDSGNFIRANILGVQNLIDITRKCLGIRFVQISTDEVYGSLLPNDPAFTEKTNLEPNSPYSASKASGDLLALASGRTHNLDILITRCSNNYGPYQFPEKLIPLVIANALENKPIPVYGDGQQVRDWIYVEDHCRAVDEVLHHGRKCEVYNIGGSAEQANLKTVETLLTLLEKPSSLISYVKDRPAHDRRYAMDTSKMQSELGWTPRYSLAEGLQKTVDWYVERTDWWKKLRGEDYFEYYKKNYDAKFATESRACQKI